MADYDPPANVRIPWIRNVVSATFGGSGDVHRVAAGDFNRDGFTDVAATSAVRAEVRVFIRTATGFTGQLVQSLPGVDAVTAGDLDGDGAADVVTTTYTNGTNDRVEWFRPLP